MGTKYVAVAVTGFNASPPPDNATTGSDNQIEWAKHINKIGTPLNTAIAANTSALSTALDQSAVSVTAAYTTTAADHNKTIQIASTVTATFQVSLGDAATMATGYIVTVSNQSNVACTIDCVTATDTINLSTASVQIVPFEAITFQVNSAANGYILVGSEHKVISSTIVLGSAVPLTTVTAANVTSITLPPGDWDIFSNVIFVTAATTNLTRIIMSISDVSATLDTAPGRLANIPFGASGLVPGVDGYSMPSLTVRSLVESASKIHYLVARGDFTVDTLSVFGKIWARRN